MYCVAGLGNPGRRYKDTRHNLGFRVVDRLAESRGTSIRREEFDALTAAVEIGRTEVLLLKPQTYMNASGTSVRAACARLGIPGERLIVVCDDTELPLGKVRIRPRGGTGGHRGLASIVQCLGHDRFVRVRLGVGRPAEGDLSAYVLSVPPPEERKVIEALVARGAEAVEAIVELGIEEAMQRFNGAPPVGTGEGA
ncbi:MAG: aminoacyl-tRNA hydrolase [Candidatus Dadabacteria bacterium]|nr:MAG: aminoacyl-tRNA hydrolase [Candidatus Dadabacteria bacterium]